MNENCRLAICATVIALALACSASGLANATSPEKRPAAQKKQSLPRELDLSSYQTPEGLLITFKNGDAADPYFGLYSLELARRAGMDIQRPAREFIRWGILNQNSDGTFGRYCRQKYQWVYCGRADSDDATLARWLQLLVNMSGDMSLPPVWQSSFNRTLKALQSLRMSNGIYSVYPKNYKGYAGYALFKDNVEVLNALENLSQYFQRVGNKEQAQRFRGDARELRTSIGKQFGWNIFALERLALNANYDKPQFYPHAVAIPFAWMEGYGLHPTRADATRWLQKYDAEWRAIAIKDYPWGLMALALLDAGDYSRAQRWLEDNQHWRQQGEHWNILEETSAQIIHYRLIQRQQMGETDQ
ncbi:hypothetical protein ACE6ZO_004092 [Salmonella enterica]|nr:hypothetical protein [Salmonella enterica]EDR1539080.1 hypothetical protein [Salmonella enterica subsp. enterica serovar Javiana]EGO3302069.1 hypothetical protein [Salmonella enterica]EHC5972834.1 hypothetical protein [Salmonella enterica]EIU9581242.1 hypothetical protein [Salmonella enterica]